MKKITILLVILFTFLFSNTSWGEWSFGKKDKKGNTFYYDKERVRKKKEILFFWELQDYGKKNIVGDKSKTTFIGLDCSLYRYMELKSVDFTTPMGEGRPRYSWTPTAEWEYPLPNSLREEMFEEICNYDSIELRLEKLKSMLNKELITEEEYNTKKQKLIDEM